LPFTRAKPCGLKHGTVICIASEDAARPNLGIGLSVGRLPVELCAWNTELARTRWCTVNPKIESLNRCLARNHREAHWTRKGRVVVADNLQWDVRRVD